MSGENARPGEKGPGVDDETVVTLVTVERLASLAPEGRRLVGLLTRLLTLDEGSLVEVLRELSAAESDRARQADRAIAKLSEGRELARHELLQAFERLPLDEGCTVRDLVQGLADGDEDSAVRAALRACRLAASRRQAECEARRRRIVDEAGRRESNEVGTS